MAKVRGAIKVNEERCKGCGICVAACPFNVIALQKIEVNNKGYHYVFMENAELCTGCTSCATVCPDSCIEVYRTKED
ncbi:MAG: 4Fe-4S dicluster-binding protein [Muribaculaceae bacterium]